MNNLTDFFKLKLLKIFNNERKLDDTTPRLISPNISLGTNASKLLNFLSQHFSGKNRFDVLEKISYGNVVLNIGSTWLEQDPYNKRGWMCLTDENDDIIDVAYENALGVVKSVKILETYNKNGVETSLPVFYYIKSNKQNFLYGIYQTRTIINNIPIFNYYLFKFNNFIDYYFAPFSLFIMHEFKIDDPFVMKEGEPPIDFRIGTDYTIADLNENSDNDALYEIFLIKNNLFGSKIAFISANIVEGKVKYISDPNGIVLRDLEYFKKGPSDIPDEFWYGSQVAIIGSEKGYNNSFILKIVYSTRLGGFWGTPGTYLWNAKINIAFLTVSAGVSYQLELKKDITLGGPITNGTSVGLGINDVNSIIFVSPESVYIGVSYAEFNFSTSYIPPQGEVKILLFENLSGAINWTPKLYEYWTHKTFDIIKNTPILEQLQSYNLWEQRDKYGWKMWYRANSFILCRSYFSIDKQYLITFKMLLKNKVINYLYIGTGFLTKDGMNVCVTEKTTELFSFERWVKFVLPFKEQNRILTLCHSYEIVYSPINFIKSQGIYNYGDINSIPSFFTPIDNDLQNFNIVEVKANQNTKLAADTNILDFTTENNNLIYSTTLQRKTMNGLPNNLWTLISNTEQPIFQQSFEITKTIFEEKILNFVVSILFKLVDQNKFNNEFANSIAKIFLNKNDVSILENLAITQAKIFFNSGIFKIINIENYVTLDLQKKELSIHFFLTFKDPTNFPTTYQLLSSNDVVIYENEIPTYDLNTKLLEIKHIIYYN